MKPVTDVVAISYTLETRPNSFEFEYHSVNLYMQQRLDETREERRLRVVRLIEEYHPMAVLCSLRMIEQGASGRYVMQLYRGRDSEWQQNIVENETSLLHPCGGTKLDLTANESTMVD